MNEILQKKILDSKIISFDMFDTLVIRIIDNPEILFDMMGEIFDIDNFKKIRVSMQAELGRIIQKEDNYPHANIDEIYDYIKEKTKIKNTAELMNYEINKEIDLLYQNKQIYDVYKFAKKNNKRIIVTSDMYLKINTINKILNKCGYKDIDKVYLSSEERKAKFDGTLYDLIIKEENVLPNEILHIGDSLKDDIIMAKAKGLNTYHYQETHIQKSESISLSIANGIIRLMNQNEDDFWVNLGSKAGLMYLGLYKELIKLGYKKINFLARDGYNLYNLFKKYNKKIVVDYIYTSRRALLLASIEKINDKAINNLPPFTLGQTIKEILAYINMENVFTENDLKKVGFKSFNDRIKSINDINKFKKIYKLKEKEVLKVCNNERKYALDYFNSKGILDKNNLFFDCGWNGSSQFLLENFIHLCNPNTDFEFYYNGIFENPKSCYQLKDRYFSAYLFDIGRNQHIAKRLKDCIVIMELFFSAPENSVLKYTKDSFVFDNYEDNLDYKEKILEGIDKFFSYALPLFEEFDYQIIPEETLTPILRLIESPTNEEAVTIGNIENVDAFAKQNGIHKYIAKLTMDDLKQNPNSEVYWKYGLIKRNDIDKRVKKIIAKKYKLKLNNEYKVNCRINGINNPSLYIVGHCPQGVKVQILSDNKEKEFKYNYDFERSMIKINCPIESSTKRVTVNLYDEKDKLVKSIQRANNKIIRIFNKSLYMFYILKLFIIKCLRKMIKPFKIIFRKTKTFLKLVKKAWTKYHFIVPRRVIKNYIKELFNRDRIVALDGSVILNPFNKRDYSYWLKNNEKVSAIEKLNYNPKISFVIPVYNVKRDLLIECLESVLNQSYKNIEICIADDCSKNLETISTLKEYATKYPDIIKIVYRKENGHISAASNSALELATGEYIAMMDNDDVIPTNAVYEMVKVLNKDKNIDLIYTDEDKLDTKGNRCNPHFKSNYAPDTLLSVNYFCHFTLLRTSILRKIGGWTVGLEGAQDWDLFLRFVEQTNNICHIPKILYHWRMLEGSTSIDLKQKSYAMGTAKKSIENALERRKTPGIVHLHDRVPYFWVEYTYKKEPLISIIIPTKDYSSTLNKCLKSIYNKTTYENFEIIVVDNRSVENATFKLFDYYKNKYKNFRVIKADMEFNYSKINNIAVNEAKGEYILLLNNDTEVITKNWLSLMVGYAMQKHVGAVGAKLIYPDRTIQHGGVVMGMGGVAGHTFVNSPMNYEGPYGRLCVPYNYSVVTAACLMVKKTKYLEVNGLTEELKVAYNDVDFCLKLLEKGYYNMMVPMVSLYHFESKSRGLEDTEEKKKRFLAESDYMNKHWKKYIDNDPMYNINLSRICVFMLDKNKEIKNIK